MLCRCHSEAGASAHHCRRVRGSSAGAAQVVVAGEVRVSAEAVRYFAAEDVFRASPACSHGVF